MFRCCIGIATKMSVQQRKKYGVSLQLLSDLLSLSRAENLTVSNSEGKTPAEACEAEEDDPAGGEEHRVVGV